MFLEPLPGIANDDKISTEGESMLQVHIASITTELSRHTFLRIGWLQKTDDGIVPGPMMDYVGREYGPFDTSIDFFQDQARRTRLNHKSSRWFEVSPTESRFACWLYDQLALRLDNYGSFPLMHPEICKSQLLLNPSFELNGVIDWDGVGIVPWLLLSTYPATLKVPWPRVECGRFSQTKVGNILKKRKLYVTALKGLAGRRNASASSIINLVDNEVEKVNIADLLVYFSDPYYQYEGRRVYNYLCLDDKQSFESFRSREISWH
jgi:hypothetical protein